MSDKFRNIHDIIYEEKEFEKLRSTVNDYEVIEKFYEIFPELKKIVVPVKIVKSKLFIKVDNSVWRSEINLRRELLIKKINNHLNKDVVKSIALI